MPRTVLLRHELPDGSWHFDWMLAREGANSGKGAGPLVTFRVMQPIQEQSIAAFSAERLEDHRPDYLSYEGEISEGRGVVHRVAEGTCTIQEEDDDTLEGWVDWGEGRRTFFAARKGGDWQVRMLATAV